MFKRRLNLNSFSTFLLYFSILIFIIAFNFQDHTPSGWYQQFMPFLNNAPLSDIIFVDSLVGYGVTGNGTVSSDTNYILKTTNGGDNWNIIQTLYTDLTKVKFLDENTGFVCGGSFGLSGRLLKTTNGGNNWFSINTPFGAHFEDMFMFNVDTIWITDAIGLGGGIFRTNNGGINWVVLYSDLGNRPKYIYMINSHVGFFTRDNSSGLFRTSDGGYNWTFLSGQNGFKDMYFIDTLTGWKSIGSIKKTTDGGFNWITQIIPPAGGIILTSGIQKFSVINMDTIWGAGGQAFFGSGKFRGIIYKTTNSGNNWMIQIPDTSFHIEGFNDIEFVNWATGWAFGARPTNFFTNIHTTIGGDTTFFTVITNLNSNIPDDFVLHQNYPNPFNPKTIISYNLLVTSFVNLKVYDLLGNEVITLVSKKQNPGSYEVEFDGSLLSSGVYFYKIDLNSSKENGKFTNTKSMILLK